MIRSIQKWQNLISMRKEEEEEEGEEEGEEGGGGGGGGEGEGKGEEEKEEEESFGLPTSSLGSRLIVRSDTQPPCLPHPIIHMHCWPLWRHRTKTMLWRQIQHVHV